MDKKRYYNFTFVIYEDDEDFESQMLAIKQTQESIWIRHDQDINEETGEPKKPHYHVVMKLKVNCTISALSKKIGVKENMIEPVKKSLNGCLKYLIHYGDDNKYNYSPDDVLANSDKLKNRFLELVTKDIPEGEKVLSIYEFINSINKPINVNVLFKYVQKHNLWDAYRRNYAIIKDLTYQHNGEILGKRYNNCDDFFSDDIDIP
mgnify:CR=1 FL=1